MRLKINKTKDIAYLYLPGHPKVNEEKEVAGFIKKQIWVHSLIKGYKGPAIYLDVDENDTVVGIEVLADGIDESDDASENELAQEK